MSKDEMFLVACRDALEFLMMMLIGFFSAVGLVFMQFRVDRAEKQIELLQRRIFEMEFREVEVCLHGFNKDGTLAFAKLLIDLNGNLFPSEDLNIRCSKAGGEFLGAPTWKRVDEKTVIMLSQIYVVDNPWSVSGAFAKLLKR